MSLTKDDVERLKRGGHRDFHQLHDDFTLRLRNTDGHCVFLIDGHCVAYNDRPDGCVLYPLIWFTEDSEPGLHDFCPHRHEFKFNVGDHEWLERSITSEDSEVEARAIRVQAARIDDDQKS